MGLATTLIAVAGAALCAVILTRLLPTWAAVGVILFVVLLLMLGGEALLFRVVWIAGAGLLGWVAYHLWRARSRGSLTPTTGMITYYRIQSQCKARAPSGAVVSIPPGVYSVEAAPGQATVRLSSDLVRVELTSAELERLKRIGLATAAA